MASYTSRMYILEESEVRRRYRDGIPTWGYSEHPGLLNRFPVDYEESHVNHWDYYYVAVRKWGTFHGLPLLRGPRGGPVQRLALLPHIVIRRDPPFPHSTDPRDGEYEVESLVGPRFSISCLLNFDHFSEVDVSIMEGLKARVTIPHAFPNEVKGAKRGDWTKCPSCEVDLHSIWDVADDAVDFLAGRGVKEVGSCVWRRGFSLFDFIRGHGMWVEGDPRGCVCGRRGFISHYTEYHMEEHEYYAGIRPVEPRRAPFFIAKVFRPAWTPLPRRDNEEGVERYVGRRRSGAVEGEEEPEVRFLMEPREVERVESHENYLLHEITDYDDVDKVRVIFEATKDGVGGGWEETEWIKDDWPDSLIEAPPDLLLLHGQLWTTEESSPPGSLHLEFSERTLKSRPLVDDFDGVDSDLLLKRKRVLRGLDGPYRLSSHSFDGLTVAKVPFRRFPASLRQPKLRGSWSYAFAHSFRLMNDVRKRGYSYRVRKTPPGKLDEIDEQRAWWEAEWGGTSHRALRLQVESKRSELPRLRAAMEEEGEEFILGADRSVWLWKGSGEVHKNRHQVDHRPARWTRRVASVEEDVPELDDVGFTVGPGNEGPRHVKGPPLSGPREEERVDVTGVADRGLLAENFFRRGCEVDVDFRYSPTCLQHYGEPSQPPSEEYVGEGIVEDHETWEAKGGPPYGATWRLEGPLGGEEGGPPVEVEEEEEEEEVDVWGTGGQESPPQTTEYPAVPTTSQTLLNFANREWWFVKPAAQLKSLLLPDEFDDPSGVQGDHCISVSRFQDHPVPKGYLLGTVIIREESAVPQAPVLAEERAEMTLHALLHKRVYERIMKDALLRGNQQTLRVEHLIEAHQREVTSSLEWDLEITRYFELLRNYEGTKFGFVVRPSIPRLMRRFSRLRSLTPPEAASDSEDEASSDESPCTSPPRNIPFVSRVVKKSENIAHPFIPISIVPGGYHRKYFHVDMHGEAVEVEEFEKANWHELAGVRREPKPPGHRMDPRAVVHLQHRYDFYWWLNNFCWNLPKAVEEDEGPEWVEPENDEFDRDLDDFLGYERRTDEEFEETCCVLRRLAPDEGRFKLFAVMVDEWHLVKGPQDLLSDDLSKTWRSWVVQLYEQETAARWAVPKDRDLPDFFPLESLLYEKLELNFRGLVRSRKSLRLEEQRREGGHMSRVDHVAPELVKFPLFRKWMVEMRKLHCGLVYDMVAETQGLVHKDGRFPPHLDAYEEDPVKEGKAAFGACAEALSPREALEIHWGKTARHAGGLAPPPGRVRIAVIQTNVKEHKDRNLDNLIRLLEHTATRPVEMVFLPEAVDYIVRDKRESVKMAEPLEGPTMTRYKELAEKHNVWMSIGGFHELLEGTSNEGVGGEPWVSNTHVVIDPVGRIVGVYRKTHLFDVDEPEAKLCFKESSFIRPGDKLVAVPDTPLGKLGLGICYDLRFPEFSAGLRAMGADVLTFPSAFTDVTGAAHWEMLLRARAIENQCFVIAAAQTGVHYVGRRSWGHSMVIDPWGTVLADGGNSVGCVITEIDLSSVAKVRKGMPLMEHKRRGLDLRLPLQHQVTEWPFGSPRGKPQEEEVSKGGGRSGRRSSFWLPAEGEGTVPFGPIKVKNVFVILENGSARAFVNRKCVVPGHVLVVSKRVAARLSDLSSEEVADMFLLVQAVEGIMEAVHGVTSSTVALQDGPDAGQTVKHVHVHVLPRKAEQFADNDDVYHELATHDKGAEVVWRADEEMRVEAEELRRHIRTHHSHLLRSD